ncbi:MAG: TIGR04283 family arsenosugar biosynthesis glycosyltransferase [Planctomycetota bacterium]
MERRLTIFTRYPEPGKTKTRLIPALGPEGAAEIQRNMTGYTLDWVRELAGRFPMSVEVRFEGGDAEKMAACFGGRVLYRPQDPGDLGCRLAAAFAEAFGEGAQQMVIIGTDCPDITPELIRESFERLATRDLVLGPAADGGYYLIGLRHPAPELFTGIPWGSRRVLEDTLRRAGELAFSVSLLKELSDVDRPEDLAVWHRARQLPSAVSTTRISVIIPTLNEADYLPRTLSGLGEAEDLEVIVVDGGSNDGTTEIAERMGRRVLHAPPGRALQMNAGARTAHGSILLFLHADTCVPPAFDSTLLAILREPGVVGGAFRLRIDAPGLPFRLIERAVQIRSHRFQMPYGDQGIFISNETFEELGGFPVLPIMEDFEFVRRLRRRGKIRIARLPVTTSGRRWQELGPWRATWINQRVILGYYLGVSLERLTRWYRADRGNSPS